MIGVDARKAFDSLDHNYMQGVLEAYGFGPKCKNWLKLLSKNLKVNGKWFHNGKYQLIVVIHSRGVRGLVQGSL